MNSSAANQYFRVYRIASLTRPNLGTGLLTGFGSFSRMQLQAFEPKHIGFYADDLAESRDEESRTEQFILQASNSLDGPWTDIKSLSPASGSNETEPDFGQCMRCGTNLEESEFALGDVCDSCRPAAYQEWQDRQDAAAEEAAEARWIM